MAPTAERSRSQNNRDHFTYQVKNKGEVHFLQTAQTGDASPLSEIHH